MKCQCIPALVFGNLLMLGAELVGTVKRKAQCFPYTFNQKLKENDKHDLVDTKGAPTLFLKWCKVGAKFIFASAFRNGTDRVATAISTIKHHWEGTVLDSSEFRRYKEDKSSLIPDFFVEFMSCLMSVKIMIIVKVKMKRK